MGNGADVVRCNIAIHMGDNALRQVIGFDLVGQCQIAQLGRAVPVAADDTLDHAFMTVVVAAGTITVTLTGCKEQRQVLRMAGFQKALFQCDGQRFRASTAYEAAGCDGIAVLHLLDGFLSGQNLNFLHVNQSFLTL